MNPNLAKLQPYPFERPRLLFKDITPDPHYPAINLGIGEPKHPTPEFIRQALTRNISGLASYPATAGTPALRKAIAAWATRRYRLTGFDALTQVLPVNGYHGNAMGLPLQAASVAAWGDEAHVAKNRQLTENTVCTTR